MLSAEDEAVGREDEEPYRHSGRTMTKAFEGGFSQQPEDETATREDRAAGQP
jgi:hypothetical protein